ncbi:MAG: AmmeMemoRadiSam system protein B [Methylococcaceae bacterium]
MNRPAAVAGLFYPANPQELTILVQQYLEQANSNTIAPKAIIAPHAGYIYSGAVAACVYARLKSVRDNIKRVVLIGPSHRVAFKGLALTQCDYFITPLSQIAVDNEAIKLLADLEFVGYLEQAHTHEHCLEVQLPFLQVMLADFEIIPIVTGDANPEQVCEVIKRLWGGAETLIVISSDLSHYHAYDKAKQLDAITSQAIEHLDYQALNFESACGRIPISGLLKFAQDNQLAVKKIALCNSGDTAGDKQKVVGYGCYVIE